MIKPRKIVPALTAFIVLALVPAAPAAEPTLADVNGELKGAKQAIGKATAAQRNFNYELALRQLERADKRTDAAARAAKQLSGAERKKAMKKVRNQRERNAFEATKLANSASGLPPGDRGNLVDSLLLFVDDFIYGGPPGSLFGPGGTIGWTGLVNELPVR